MTGTQTRSVVVCDDAGNPLRTAGVLEVHEGSGVLHKAFSILVFRNAGTEVLLQQRSADKRLFRLRWANTCCSHPAPSDEQLVASAQRRLHEEFGFSVALREAGAFVYRAADPDGDLSEYEYDTVLVGEAEHPITPRPDPSEIADWRWVAVDDLQRDLRDRADAYAPWLPQALRIALAETRGRARS